MTFEVPDYCEVGLFSHRVSPTDFTGKPALFLDRDGVLIEETNYLHRIEDVVLIHGVTEAIRKANAAGVAVVIVTNQAGIGRGYFNWHDFQRVQRHIFDACRSSGAHWDMVLACAYHRDGVTPFRKENHPWRKPEPGMLLEAARVLGVDLSHSHVVGDTLSDLAAGARAGLPGGTLVLTGHGEREWRESGAAVFAEYKEHGSFTPHLASDGAEAIEHWLAGFTLDANVA